MGQVFEIDARYEESGQPDYQAPMTHYPSVVARTAVTGKGGDGRYEAVGVGVATLSTSSIYCVDGPLDSTATTSGSVARTCPVARVIVTG
jgi:hypothetical protein